MTAAQAPRAWIVPEIKLIDLAARSTLTEQERRRLIETLQEPPTSTSNVTGGVITGSPPP
jgi:hypothetical protein